MNGKENVVSMKKVTRISPLHLTTPLYSRYEKLPCECLYAIIRCLESDRKTLYNLLLVNKFFFHTAIRLLFKDSFVTSLPIQYDLRFESAFFAFLQARINETLDDSYSNNLQLSQIVDRILMKFGLELTESSKDKVHQRISRLVDNLNPVPAMMTDYSKLFNVFSRISGKDLKHQRNLQLLKMPRSMKLPRSTEGNDVAGINSGGEINDGNITEPALDPRNCNEDSDDNREHSYQQQNEETNIIDLQQAITAMWCHYNHNYITSLTFATYQAHKFLPYAIKLTNLDTLFLNRSYEIATNHLEDTIAFIIQNQMAFPKKKSLNVDCNHHSWDYKSEIMQDQAVFNSLGHVLYFTRLRQHRDRITQFMRPYIMICEAVRNPRTLNVSHIPEFYNLAEKIEVDQLIELCDFDEFRFEMGEGDAMESFLWRCENLRILSLAVFQNETFSWISQGEQATMKRHQLMKLEELCLQCGQNYYSGITTFNDAMRIFASTLKSAKIQEVQLRNRNGVNSNPGAWPSIQLDILINNNDDLPVLLPCLTTLRIAITGTLGINVGSINNCPYLQVLEIELGGKGLVWPKPHGVEMSGYTETGEILDPNWQQPIVDHSLFPVWNLPRLRSLKLVNMAAMRFDFASLPYMQQLENLSIQDRNRSYSKRDIVKYVIRQQKINSIQVFSQSNGVFGTLSVQEWSLPNLNCIKLQGPPTAIFCLEYLRLFPRLKSIELNNLSHPIEIQRYPLPHYINTEPQEFGLIVHNTRFDVSSYMPIIGSQLQEFKLANNVFMSHSNVTSILTTYAPFLEKIFASKLQDRDSKYKGSFLDAIFNADKKNNIYNKALTSKFQSNIPDLDPSGKKPLGQKLLHVYYGQLVSFIDADNLGLKPVVSREPYIKLGVRIYDTLGHTLVPTESYVL
ncbi:hypothetical protein BGZ76_008193 [Entomortierella beljakovae]|nr:hypothetical protein BGZ76_008193 [Entomortierella beljakovae]